MKKIFLVLVSLVMVASLVFISCGGGSSTTGGSYLNTFMNAQPNTLDPSRGSDMYGNTVLLNILEPLIRFDSQKGEIIPAGAESYTISDDGLTYTFKLRDMKWSDGKKLTSEDYAYGIRRSADPETGCLYSNFLYPLVNGVAVLKGEMSLDDLGVSTPDEKTLVLKLHDPLPYFLDLVMQRTYFPQRKDMVEKYGDSYSTAPENAPQCGPFILNDWIINSVMHFEKNKDYWNAANVSLDKVEVKIITELNSVFNALLSGEIDLAGVNDPEWRKKFEGNPEFTHIFRSLPDVVYIMVNCEDPLMKNVKIRQAIAAAIDRPDLIKACRDGVGVPAYWLSPPAITCQAQPFNEDGKGPLKTALDNLTKSPRELFIEGLEELGLDPDPSKYTIGYNSSGKDQKSRIEVEYLQQLMKDKIGFNLEPSLLDWNEFINQLNAKNYQMGVLAWNADFNDPSNFLETAWPPSGTYVTTWDNPEFNKCITDAQIEQDPKKRVKLLKRAETILIAEDYAIIPLITRESHSFRKAFLKNVPNNPFDNMGWQVIDSTARK